MDDERMIGLGSYDQDAPMEQCRMVELMRSRHHELDLPLYMSHVDDDDAYEHWRQSSGGMDRHDCTKRLLVCYHDDATHVHVVSPHDTIDASPNRMRAHNSYWTCTLLRLRIGRYHRRQHPHQALETDETAEADEDHPPHLLHA